MWSVNTVIQYKQYWYCYIWISSCNNCEFNVDYIVPILTITSSFNTTNQNCLIPFEEKEATPEKYM